MTVDWTERPKPRVVILTSGGSPIVGPLVEAGLNVVGVVEVGGQAEAEGPLLSGSRRLYHRLTGQRTMRELLAQRRIPTRRSDDVHDPRLADWLDSLACDILIVYSAPILPETLYARVEWAINLHPSLLPKYRGKHPLFWAVWDDEVETGCTVHVLEERADTGAIVAQASFAIPAGVRERELARHAEVDVGVPLLLEAVDALWRGTADLSEQPEVSPTRYAKRLSPAEALDRVPYGEWPLERVWKVLRFLDVTPLTDSSTSRPIVSWHVGGRERRPGRGGPGSLQRDLRGYYVSHPRGRIRIVPMPRIKNLAWRGLEALGSRGAEG